MAYDRIWPGRYNVLPFTDTELESEKTTEGAITPPADETPRDSECSAENKKESNGCVLYRGNRVGVCCMIGDSSDFCEGNNPVKCLYGRKPVFNKQSEDPLVERLTNNLFT